MKDTIFIDSYECNGCGSCVMICPDIFTLATNSEKVEVLQPYAEITPTIEEAAAFCPKKCIILVTHHS